MAVLIVMSWVRSFSPLWEGGLGPPPSPTAVSSGLGWRGTDLLSVSCKVQRMLSRHWMTGWGRGWPGAKFQLWGKDGQIRGLPAEIKVPPASWSDFTLGHIESLYFKGVTCVSFFFPPFFPFTLHQPIASQRTASTDLL